MSNQVGDCFKFLQPFHNIRTLPRLSSQPASIVGGLVIHLNGLNWLDSTKRWLEMTYVSFQFPYKPLWQHQRRRNREAPQANGFTNIFSGAPEHMQHPIDQLESKLWIQILNSLQIDEKKLKIVVFWRIFQEICSVLASLYFQVVTQAKFLATHSLERIKCNRLKKGIKLVVKSTFKESTFGIKKRKSLGRSPRYIVTIE